MTTIKPICGHYGEVSALRQGALRTSLVVQIALALLVLPAALISAQDDVWERALEAVNYNRQAEAVPLLQAALAQNPSRGEAVRMLAVAYQQTSRPGEAENALRTAVESTALDGDDRARIAFDLGALLQRSERHEEAIAMYGRALELDNTVASAYLNRANARLALGELAELRLAVTDYELYLALRPGTAQRPQIEQVIRLINGEIEAEQERQAAEAERQAAVEEARAAAAAAAREAEEATRAAAAERRQRMLDSVLQSLGTATNQAQSVELESEEIENYEEDLDIVD